MIYKQVEYLRIKILNSSLKYYRILVFYSSLDGVLLLGILRFVFIMITVSRRFVSTTIISVKNYFQDNGNVAFQRNWQSKLSIHEDWIWNLGLWLIEQGIAHKDNDQYNSYTCCFDFLTRKLQYSEPPNTEYPRKKKLIVPVSSNFHIF